MSTHQTDALYTSESQIHRALVQYSSTATGEIQVIIPSVTGLNSTVPISYFGREAHPFENDWVVPNVGSSIVVCREDEDYTSVYWLNTTYNPVRADIGDPNPTEYGFGPSGLGFPLMAITPTSSGLYLSNTHMGYYDADPPSGTNAAWRTFMSYNGNFYLTGSGSATHGLTWTANTNTLAISGNIIIRNPADVRDTLEVGLNAEANPDSYLFGVNHDLLDITNHPDGGEDVLVLSATHLGHHNGNGLISGWKTYMSKSGDFYLAGDGSHGLTWDGSVLALDGNITIRNLGDVREDLEVEQGSEANPANYTFGPGLAQTLANISSHPSSAGLFLGGNYLGYHTGNSAASGWRAYLDSGGNFGLTAGGAHSLSWNSSTGVLDIAGDITIRNVSEVLTAIGVTAGAEPNTSAQDNPANYTFGPGLTQTLANITSHPTTAGLFLGGNYMGYHTGTGGAAGWKAYMDSSGNFGLSGSGSHSLSWNGSALTITGTINILNPSDVLTAIGVTAGAQPNSSSQDNPPNYSFGGDATFDLNAVPAEGSINAAGLYLGSNNLGYHNGTVWKSYMDSSGRFYLGGTSGALQWDGSTLTVTGNIIVSNASTVRSALNVADGAAARDSAQDNPSTYSFSSDGTGATFNLDPVPNSGAAGLHIGSDKLGFWNGSAWKTYMQSNGNFYLSGSGSNSLSWDGSALAISGVITASTFTGGSLSIPQSNPTFSVNSAGALTATSATISGDLIAGTIGIGTNDEFSVASNGQLTVGPNGTTKLRVQPSVSSNFIFNNAAALEFYEGSTVYGYIQGDSQDINLFGGPSTLTGVLMGSSDNYVGVFQSWIGKTYGVVLTAVASGYNKILLNATTGVEISSQSGTPPTGGTLYNHNGALKWNGTDLTANTNTTYQGSTSISLVGTTFSHGDTSSQASSNNSGQTFIQDITLDTYGHITGLNEATVRGPLEGWWGSAGAPTYSFNGDTNTGMYRAAADTIGFSCGGSERMRIDSSGNVGIGRTPSYALDVNGTSRSDIHFLATDGTSISPALRFTNDTDAGMYLSPDWLMLTSYGTWKIGAARGYSTGVALNLGSTGTWGSSVTYSSGVVYVYSSRGTLKENVESVSSAAALTRIKALRPVEFNFKQEAVEHGTNEMVAFNRQRGFIAEEVAAADHTTATWGWIDPEDEYSELALLEIPDDLSLDTAVPTNYSLHAIMADLVSVVQDLSTKLEAAESRIATLEAS